MCGFCMSHHVKCTSMPEWSACHGACSIVHGMVPLWASHCGQPGLPAMHYTTAMPCTILRPCHAMPCHAVPCTILQPCHAIHDTAMMPCQLMSCHAMCYTPVISSHLLLRDPIRGMVILSSISSSIEYFYHQLSDLSTNWVFLSSIEWFKHQSYGACAGKFRPGLHHAMS